MSLDERVSQLESIVTILLRDNEQLKQQLSEYQNYFNNNLTKDLSVSTIVADPYDTKEKEQFKKFIDANKEAKRKRKESKRTKEMKILYEIFSTIKLLDEVGVRNSQIFKELETLVEIINSIKPAEAGWTLTYWWGQAQTLTIAELTRNLEERLEKKHEETCKEKIEALEAILVIVKSITAEQDKHRVSASIWNLYVTTAEPDITQVKTAITKKLDNSGFELCKKLQELIKSLDSRDPAKFLEDHCQALVDDSEFSEDQMNRVKQFAEAYVIGDDWVLVDSDEEADPDWFTWGCRKIKSVCTLYGYNKTIDGWLDSANEYKSTCSRVKTTIEWAYFGGRLIVDPTGAVLSLLW